MPGFRRINILILPLIFSLITPLAISQDNLTNLDSLNKQAQYYSENLMPDSVLWLIAENLQPYESDTSSEYYNILMLGLMSAINIQNHPLADKLLLILEEICDKTDDPGCKASLYLDAALSYKNMREYGKSMKYCNLAYPMFVELNNPKGTTEVLLAMYNNSYFSQEDSTNNSYLDQAIEIAVGTNDSSLLSDVYFNAGKALARSNDFENAISNYKKAKQFTPKEQIGFYLTISIYQHLSYTLCDSVDQACELSQNILNTSLANEFIGLLSNAYLGRAYCCAKRGMIDSTRIYLDLSEEERSRTPKVKVSPGYYNQMYKVSMIISDYDRALRYLEIKADQENQINRENRAIELGDARAEFDYLLQKARISELKAQNTATEEKAKRRKISILGISAILLISLGAFLNIRAQYVELGNIYKNLVKKHVEVDRLNTKLLNEQKNRSLKRAGVNIKDEDRILEKLKELLEEDKIYKNQDLNLSTLALDLETNTSYLSTIINTHFRVNLKSLINKYRIDEARKLLVSEEASGYSIEGIAHEVGFQSRSVFYQTFRQITGMTPTAYVKTYKAVPAF